MVVTQTVSLRGSDQLPSPGLQVDSLSYQKRRAIEIETE